MNKEIEILIDGKPTKMELPPDMQDSKIVIENGKVFAEIGVVDYINNLNEENQRLNNVLNELEKWVYQFREEHKNETGIFDKFLTTREVLDKLKELKESDKH